MFFHRIFYYLQIKCQLGNIFLFGNLEMQSWKTLNGSGMFIANRDAEIHLLKLQIELKESNYRYAVELLKDCNILIRMREHIRELKECLENIQEKSTIKMNSISKVNI